MMSRNPIHSPSPKSSLLRSAPLRAGYAISLLLAVLLTGCGRGQQQAAAPPPPAVTVAEPVKKMIVDHDEYVGRFAAINSVEVRARVSGTLESVNFTDGQIVNKGDLLFTIDKRPFQNALDQARANLVQARSTLTLTTSDLSRGQQLVRDKTITEQTFDQRTQAKRNAEGAVANAEAALRQAELDLEFTDVRSPIKGRIGDRRVSPGNLVTGGTGTTTLLATIVSTDPIHFDFTYDEAAYLRYERMSGNIDDVTTHDSKTPIALKLIDEKEFKHKGAIDFVDNVIDRSTGTIRGRAVLDNPTGLFTPGMFARIQVASSPPYEALLVPDTAIGNEQVRKFVYVVDAQNIAQQKYVTLGTIVDGMRVIKDGLAANDRVIVDGVARIRPKQKVTPQEKGKTAATDDKTASAKGQPAPNAAAKPDASKPDAPKPDASKADPKTDPKSDAGAKPAAPKQ